jgi:hypothetical protein
MHWRARIAHDDPYRDRETTGEAQPTITRPTTHSTPTRTAMAGAVGIEDSRPPDPDDDLAGDEESLEEEAGDEEAFPWRFGLTGLLLDPWRKPRR